MTNRVQRGKLLVSLLSMFFVLVVLDVSAQSKAGYWKLKKTPVRKGADIPANKKALTKFKLFELDAAGLKTSLARAPQRNAEGSRSGNIVSFPDADGSLQRFNVYETYNMEPELAAKFPEIKSYVGKGIEDPTAIIYFSVSPLGLQTMLVRADKPTVFIEPYTTDLSAYAIYKKGDKVKSQNAFECRVINTVSQTINSGTIANRGNADDGNFRTYRLALSVTGEYTTYFGGTRALALAAMNNSMTRVNGVFEIDFGVHMNLIANDTILIYLDAATDPYSAAGTGAGGAWNLELQNNLTSVLGNGAYDIGHLFGASGGGGNAGCIGCVCTNPTVGVPKGKGSGFTSPNDAIPSGDNFDIDYVAHEMGHQFGGNHTFSHGYEGTGVQDEPGSGSTIMGYAGITSYDVQPHSDAYFHAVTIQQVTNYIKSAPCAVTIPTGNAIPTAEAGPNYTIPRGTPFALTGVGTDANDAGLTYCWEQMNSVVSGTTPYVPSVTATNGPAFRSFSPSSNPIRYFPRLSTIQAGATSWTWEAVPNVARTMEFRFTVRDNHAGGPANNSDSMFVTVSTASGPFVVTAPNTAVSWGSATTQTVTWNVASSTSAPVSCANVKISLSTDGGNTFPTVLLASTANDGSEVITVPATPTTQARIKVEAVGNIFFDMSNVNFTIFLSSPVVTVITTSALASNIYCAGAPVSVTYNIDGPANAGNYFKAQLSNAAGSFASPVNLDSVLSTVAGTINTTIPPGTTPGGGYRIRVVSTNPVVNGSNNGSNISIYGIPDTAGAISGSVTVCQGQTGVVYSVPAIANAATYVWTLPANAFITAGANTNSITVTFPNTSPSGNVTVYGSNPGCTGTSSSLAVTVVVPITVSGLQTFSNTSSTKINALGVATPYPSTITVSGLSGTIQDVNVDVTGVSHTYPDDIDILLEAPGTQKVTLMSDCGGSSDILNRNITLNDSAASNLPDATAIGSGSYKPTNIGSPDNYTSPGPGSYTAAVGAASTPLSVLNSLSPNGIWKLYVMDGFADDSGSIASWTIKMIILVDSSVISGTAIVCQGQMGVSYSIPAVANATGYTWNLPPGAFIASGANTNSIAVNFSGSAISGNITVTPFNFCGNGMTSKKFNVGVSLSGAADVSIAAVPSGPVCTGTNVTFTATPFNGGTTPTYQWKKNGVNVGTGVSYSNAGLTSNDSITCVMTSNATCVSGNPATSNLIVMTVNPVMAPSVSIALTTGTNPQCASALSVFTATPINGGSAPFYQWKINGSNAGTNSATLSTTSLLNGDQIACSMTSNSACASPAIVTSDTLTITVNEDVTPSVSIALTTGTNPQCAGASATFTASTNFGGTSPTYQWYVNGIEAGTDSPAFTTGSLVNGDQVTCDLTSNALCATLSLVTSNTLTMTVNQFVTPSVSIALTSGTNPLCTGASATFTATPTNGGTTPSYQWKKNGVNVGTGISYSDAGLTTGDSISCVMTSNAACVSGNPATSDLVVMTVNPCSSITLNLKIFIEGFYSGNGLMFPVADPTGQPSLFDTVTVELHDSTAPHEIVDSAVSTLSTNGNGSFVFAAITPGNSYFIVVRHRSSLATWSKNPVPFVSTTESYDFTRP